MPLKSVFLEFIDQNPHTGSFNLQNDSPKSVRNLQWRLRLEQNLHHYPAELTEMWSTFFSLLANQGDMTSDKLMAAAQMMFQIEEYLKVTPSIPQKVPVPKLSDWVVPNYEPSTAIMEMLKADIDNKAESFMGVPLKILYGDEKHPNFWAASAPVFKSSKKKP